MKKYSTPGQTCKELGIHFNTLQSMAKSGAIDFIETPGGHRRYDVAGYISKQSKPTTILYARVSSAKQKDDLQKQVEYLKTIYPGAEVISDVGSGLNFKRQGIRSILERIVSGEKLRVVVAYRDRLCRFGSDIIEQLLASTGGELVVLHNSSTSPEKELVDDLLAIVTVFAARSHCLRKYKAQIKSEREDFNEKDRDKANS